MGFLTKRKQQALLPHEDRRVVVADPSRNLPAVPHKPRQHEVSGTRRQWRTVALIVVFGVMLIYGAGSANGLALVGATRGRMVATPFVIQITPTVAENVRAEMVATVVAMNIAAEMEQAAVPTKTALDLELAQAQVIGTVAAIEAAQLMAASDAEMYTNIQSLQLRQQVRRNDIITDGLFWFVMVVCAVLSAVAIIFLTSSAQQVSATATTFAKQLGIGTPKKQPVRALPLRDTRRQPVTRSPEPVEMSASDDEVTEQTTAATARPDQPLVFQFTDAEGTVHTRELKIPNEIHEKLYGIANRVLAGADFSKRGMRGTLTEAQYRTLRSIFIDADFIVQERGKSAEFTPMGQGFLTSCAMPYEQNTLEPLPI